MPMSASQHARETLMALIEEMADFGSWEYQLTTRKVTLSPHLLHMCRVNPEADWRDEIRWENLHFEDRDRARMISSNAISLCKPFESAVRYRMPDGQLRTYFIRGLPVAGRDGKAKRVIGIVRDITEQLHSKNERLHLLHALMRTRDDERRRVALDLHESAGQSLAALKMSLGLLGEILSKRTKGAHMLLQSSLELLEGAIREVRTISYLMHPPMLDEAGLDPALRWYARGFSERSGIKVRVDVAEAIGRYAHEVEITIFRIVQEALTNVHRYSGSPTAIICLARENEHIRAEIQDEGCGLQSPAAPGDRFMLPGVGIAGMRERVEQLNGTFEIESIPGRGTTVRAILPLTTLKLPRLTQTDPEVSGSLQGFEK
jgi:signal transduction histidine kinase